MEYFTTGRGPSQRSKPFRIRIPSFRSLPPSEGKLVGATGARRTGTTIDWWRSRFANIAVFVNGARDGWRRPSLRPAILELIEHFAEISHLASGLKRIDRDGSLRSESHDFAPVCRGSDIRGLGVTLRRSFWTR